MTGSGAYSVDGQYNTGVTGQGTANGTLTFTVPDNAPSTLAYVCQFHASMGGTINIVENTDQHYIYQTVALTSGSAYVMSTHARWNGRDYIVLNPDGNSKTWFDIRNGFVSSSQGTVATASITRVSGSASNPSGSWYRCAMVFTSSVSTPYNTSIQVATTDGDLTYGSLTGLSGSFLWGAQFEPGDFISPYLSNNTGTAFTTSSILNQMKFNLKNTGSFSGSYFGGWSPGYSGNKPNGVNGYMDTGLIPSTSLALNSTHLGVYLRRNIDGLKSDISVIQDSVSSARDQLNIYPRYSNQSYYRVYDDSNSTVSNTNSQGLYLANRVSSLETRNYKNTTLAIKTTTVGTHNTSKIIIGAGGTLSGTPNAFSDRENAFATIGDGLTDYEAKALYWIVQKYQTTLGRQVY